jgi:hypothetical protein
VKSSTKPGAKAAARQPRRRGRGAALWLKAFVWVLLAIFVLTSVGVALVVTAAR